MNLNQTLESLKSASNFCLKQEKVIEELQKVIAEKNEEISGKDKVIAEKNKEISGKDKEIAQKNEEISEKDKVIAQKNEEISGKDKAIAEKNKEISGKDKVIAEKNEEIHNIRRSRVAIENEKPLVQKTFRSTKHIKEAFLRFPHLPEQIFEIIDNQSLANSRLVAISWRDFVDDSIDSQIDD